jgi:hypothetical protein
MVDTQSETWKAVDSWLDDQLAGIARKLASKTSNHEDTMFNRGVHAAFLSLKEMPHRSPMQPVDLYDSFN